MLPKEILKFCILHTHCKAVLLDLTSANQIIPITAELTAGLAYWLICGELKPHQRQSGMKSFQEALRKADGFFQSAEVNILPEDNAMIMFTSGKQLELNEFIVYLN
jgi:hypothetical protein